MTEIDIGRDTEDCLKIKYYASIVHSRCMPVQPFDQSS